MKLNTTVSFADSYQEEVRLRLNNSKIYLKLIENHQRGIDNGTNDLITLIHDAVFYCHHRSKLVLKHMGEFTLHDSEHLFRVLRLMGLLIPEDTLNNLSNPELGLLILTAFFHDIGMSPSENEVKNWLGIWNNSSPTEKELNNRNKYIRFRNAKQLQLNEINYLRSQGFHAQADIVEKYLISEYIRTTHAERAIDILSEDWVDKIKYKDNNLSTELALLCKSHNEDGVKLLELEHSIIVGNETYICLPFIGVILRLADILDFDGSRTPKVLFAHLGIKNPVSLKEWEKHRSVESWTISRERIVYNANCNHPAIEAAIKQFCNFIDYELASCNGILNNLHDTIRNPFPAYYKIPLPSKVEQSKINAKKDISGNPIYLYRDTKFTLNKEQITDILMGTKLYGQPSVALRELIQNSIDACKLRQKMEESWGNYAYKPKISIRFSKEGNTSFLEVDDNGVGMDQNIIDKYYSKVGTSYYTSSDFLDLKSSLKSSFIPTSRFGIGILSCFMVSDSIEVETKRLYEEHNSSSPLYINITGQESIFYIKNGQRKNPGTTTKLQLKYSNPWIHANSEQIIKFIKKTVPFPPFDIIINSFSESYVHSPIDLTCLDYDLEPHSAWLLKDESIRDIKIILNGEEGITGICNVAVIESNNLPVTSLSFKPKMVLVEDESFELKTSWNIHPNRILKKLNTIELIPNTEKVTIKESHTDYLVSKSQLALRGIEIPMSLFAQWMGQIYQQAKVNWPICVLINIDIGGSLDINLNSARTEILMDDKWSNFESILLKQILLGIKNSVKIEYWSKFKSALLEIDSPMYHNFIAILKSID